MDTEQVRITLVFNYGNLQLKLPSVNNRDVYEPCKEVCREGNARVGYPAIQQYLENFLTFIHGARVRVRGVPLLF